MSTTRKEQLLKMYVMAASFDQPTAQSHAEQSGEKAYPKREVSLYGYHGHPIEGTLGEMTFSKLSKADDKEKQSQEEFTSPRFMSFVDEHGSLYQHPDMPIVAPAHRFFCLDISFYFLL